MIGNHVTGQANAVVIGAIAKVDIGTFPAQVIGDPIVIERIGGCHSVGIAAEQLDGFRGAAALPHADEPERVETAARQGRQLFVGNFVEAAEMATILFAELRKPDIGALGNEDRAGHPGRVGAEFFVLVGRVAEDRYFGLADDGWPLLFPAFATPAGSFLCSGAHAARVGIELHPDGEFLFAQDFSGDHEETVHAIAEEGLPQSADQRELLAQGPWGAGGRCAQKVNQAHLACTFHGDQRARGEIFGKFPGDLPVDCLFGQALFFEELIEWLERLVAVRCPKKKKFFESDRTVGHSVGSTGEPLLRGFKSADDALAGKMLDKGQEELVDLSRADLGGEPIQRSGHHLGVKFLAVLRQHDVAGLIDQTHGKQLAGMNRAVRKPGRIANLVHLIREGAACGEVGKNDVAVKGKQRIRKPIAFPCCSRNMEFHHVTRAPDFRCRLQFLRGTGRKRAALPVRFKDVQFGQGQSITYE